MKLKQKQLESVGLKDKILSNQLSIIKNSTLENTIFNSPIQIDGTDIIRIYMLCDILNNTGTNRTVTLIIRLGGQLLYQTTLTFSTSTIVRRLNINSLDIMFTGVQQPYIANFGGVLTYNSSTIFAIIGNQITGISQSTNLSISVKMSVANVNFQIMPKNICVLKN